MEHEAALGLLGLYIVSRLINVQTSQVISFVSYPDEQDGRFVVIDEGLAVEEDDEEEALVPLMPLVVPP